MFYTSTRDKTVRVTSAQAITHGISADGGLFVPVEIPKLTLDDISALAALGYKERAKRILAMYLTDFTESEIDSCVEGAYADGKFSSEKIAPLVTLGEGAEVLELWKGPTCAFKDMALQLLPQLLTVASEKAARGRKLLILVATSGDTGKAALEGFKDVPNTKIMVFYPEDGVSPMQKLQMTTQEGENVGVCAIKGNFDDAQNGVKAIFTDKCIAARLEENGTMFSSANSINWGRLVPQVVYYISAYCEMLNKGAVKLGDGVNFVVPTGNFGNILAAFYAREMGLPVKRLICASNANNVLTDFLTTGVYDRNRHFYTTASPSMDILISSNLERLLFTMSGFDDAAVRGWMGELSASGVYNVGAQMLKRISDVFSAGFCDDEGTKNAIHETYESRRYLCDTHTGVAVNVFNAYRRDSHDATPTVIVSTASPFKFCRSVLDAVAPGAGEGLSEFDMVDRLAKLTGEKCPAQLAGLSEKRVRFTGCCEQSGMEAEIFKF